MFSKFESYELVWTALLFGAAFALWPENKYLLVLGVVAGVFLYRSKKLFVFCLLLGLFRCSLSLWHTAPSVTIPERLSVHISNRTGWYSLAETPSFNLQSKASAVGYDLSGSASLLPLSSLQFSFPFLKERFFFERNIIGRLKWLEKPDAFYRPSLLERIRTASENLMKSSSSALSGFRRAMFLGDGSGIPRDIWEKLNFLGLSHAIVISGSHLTALAMILIVIFSFVSRMIPRMKILVQKLLVSFGILFFSLICGFEISLLRACLCFFLVGLLSYFFPAFHRIEAYKKLSFVGIILFFIHPLDCFRASYALSFSSTWSLLRANLKINFLSALVPFLMIYFVASMFGMTMHPLSPICNFLLLPILYFLLVPLSLLALLIPSFDFFVGGLILNYYWLIKKFAVILERLPLPPLINSLSALFSLVVMVFIFIQRQWSVQRKIALGFLVIFIAVLYSFQSSFGSSGSRLSISVIDIGQGDAYLLKWPETKVVIDGGSDQSAAKKFLPSLLKNNDQRFNLWVLSHFDRDHSGAFNRVGRFFSVRDIWIPRLDQKRFKNESAATVSSADQKYLNYCKNGYCLIGWIDPERQHLSKSVTNHDSLVLFLVHESTKHLSAVFLGDLEASGEVALLQFLYRQKIFYIGSGIDILKAAHHGSRTSSTRELVEFLKPAIALISCGRHNQYGHPHEEILERLEAVDAVVFRTDALGDFEVFF